MSQSREPRYAVAVPVVLPQGTGMARNISTSGIYFETELPLEPGAPLSFSVQFDDSPGGPMRMQCEARIVRVEKKDGKVGVGAQIGSLRCERLEAPSS